MLDVALECAYEGPRTNVRAHCFHGDVVPEPNGIILLLLAVGWISQLRRR